MNRQDIEQRRAGLDQQRERALQLRNQAEQQRIQHEKMADTLFGAIQDCDYWLGYQEAKIPEVQRGTGSLVEMPAPPIMEEAETEATG